ncbi:MAG: hypothetical protein H6867_07910 [Rhodospirillales bacterium]|nr:hypothetical protein [Rhodospirillales bacterium]MCB9995477.1 hypothetical protein [Rhodospirillales bacterium]
MTDDITSGDKTTPISKASMAARLTLALGMLLTLNGKVIYDDTDAELKQAAHDDCMVTLTGQAAVVRENGTVSQAFSEKALAACEKEQFDEMKETQATMNDLANLGIGLMILGGVALGGQALVRRHAIKKAGGGPKPYV